MRVFASARIFADAGTLRRQHRTPLNHAGLVERQRKMFRQSRLQRRAPASVQFESACNGSSAAYVVGLVQDRACVVQWRQLRSQWSHCLFNWAIAVRGGGIPSAIHCCSRQLRVQSAIAFHEAALPGEFEAAARGGCCSSRMLAQGQLPLEAIACA